MEQKKQVEAQIAALNKYMEKIDYKIWYYETALEAGTEAVHQEKKCLEDIKRKMAVKN